MHRGRFHDERDGSALPWLLGIAGRLVADAARHDRVETRARERLGLPTALAADDGHDEVERRYVLPPLPGGHPHYTLAKIAKDGSYALRIATPHGTVRQTVAAPEASALRTGSDQIDWSETWNGHKARLQPMIAPTARSLKASTVDQPNDTSLSFAAQLHRLLQSGHAHVAGQVTVDGRAAIKIEILAEHQKPWLTYYVDPTTYRPIELDTYGYDSTDDVTRLVFHTYRQLPLKGNATLLRLHPAARATIDHSATGYFKHTPAPLLW